MGIYYKQLDYPRIPDELLSTKLDKSRSRIHRGLEADGSRIKYDVYGTEYSAITYNVGFPDNPELVEEFRLKAYEDLEIDPHNMDLSQENQVDDYVNDLIRERAENNARDMYYEDPYHRMCNISI